ncbi:MAG: hypothetical protein KKD48_04945 [Nanoarchaeota archaeon]|nr:hypothetical protein [Nanoarchaeota archaeon]
MIKKHEIISVLIDAGLSIIESNRVTDDIQSFRFAIEDIISKAYEEGKTFTKHNYR